MQLTLQSYLATHSVLLIRSGANAMNPLLNRKYMKIQKSIEKFDRPSIWGQKSRDSLTSYLKILKTIIKQYAPQIGKPECKSIAILTRGLNKKDIGKVVDRYVKTGKLDCRPDHPTNTCDPYTGNWVEHLMDPNLLVKLFSGYGFEVYTASSYWGCSKKTGLDPFIRFFHVTENMPFKFRCLYL